MSKIKQIIEDLKVIRLDDNVPINNLICNVIK